MKVIGDRISVIKKEGLLSIVILPTTDKKKLGLMMLWLMAWTICGLIVLANYFKVQDQSSKLFIIVYLSFWAYYEFKISRAFIWKKWGKEKLWVQKGILHYQREIQKKGKVKEYNIDLINDLKLIETNDNNFSDFIGQSFWIKGGERIELSYQAKTISFGMQLKTEEANIILKEIQEIILKILDKR